MLERPHKLLQQNLLALLCHNDEHGKIVANLVESELFEGDYRVIAERAINYWRQHAQSPKTHTADLLADILEDPDNRAAQTYRHILISLIELSEQLNPQYTLSSIYDFVTTQKYKSAIINSFERINSKQEMAIEEVKEIWYELLRSDKDTNFNPGMKLFDFDRVLSYLDSNTREFRTGIKELNTHNIVPSRGAVMLFLAATGKGKTWWLVDIGKQTFQLRKKIVHISLEIPEEEVLLRYYQNLFAVAKWEGTEKVLRFKFDKDVLKGFNEIEYIPDFTFSSPQIRDELRIRVNWFGTRCQNLIIKRFPIRSLTMNGLRAYLDNLETNENFIPDLLILDYIGITKTSVRDHRINLGRNFEDFRAICVERNVAGVTAHQISREGERSHRASRAHVAEDWSLIGTADNVITYSQTKGEERFGLARLFVDKARTEKSGFSMLITQHYAVGQFCLQSVMLNPIYEKLVESLTENKDDEDEEAPDEE